MANMVTGLRLPPDVRQWLRQRAVDLDATLTAVVTEVVRERIAAEAPTCPGCGTPRRVGHPDPLHDAMAHAQCDQNLAALDAGASGGAGRG